MKVKIVYPFLFMILSGIWPGPILAQKQPVEPYTARAYWLEEQNEVFHSIFVKKGLKQALSPSEVQYFEDYTNYLKNYFSKLSPTEQRKYIEFKGQWDEELEARMEEEDSDISEIKGIGVKPGRKFLFSNGIYGFGYGLVGAYLFEAEYPAAIAIPFLTSGLGLLWPYMVPQRYEGISFATVLMSRHGKFIGALHGAALGYLLVGNPDYDQGKLIGVTSVLGSIALGELGFQLSRNGEWSEGRVSTYRYYSLLGPGLGFSGLIAGNVDDPRIYGATVLLTGAAGYLIADKVYERYQFTRGDMLAASSFGMLSTAFGFGLVNIDERWEMLVPAATALGGTLINHAILKNRKYTSKEGWNINYATGAGVVLGLGIAILANPQSHYAYFILPSSGGLLGWYLMAGAIDRDNLRTDRESGNTKTRFSFDLTPQNYFINKQLVPDAGKSIPGLPVFRLAVTF